MKYPIEDIKTWGEIIIDDDQTFEELIEFYLPFRLSEIDPDITQKAEVVKDIYSGSWGNESTIALRLNPKGPSLFDVEEYINDNLVSEPEIKEWMEKITYDKEYQVLACLYISLATHADKSKDDRVLAMDIVYCLLGIIRYGGKETMEGWEERVFKTIIAEQVAIQWGNRGVAGFIMADVLAFSVCLGYLEESVDDSFFGALSDLVGVECYFDRISEMIEEDKGYFFENTEDIDKVIVAAKRSLHYLDNDIWARELYKNLLEVHHDADADWYALDMEHIMKIAESITKDLKDKQWGEEVSADFLSFWNNKKEVLVAVKNNGYALSNASEELQADKDVVLAAVKNNGYALPFASKELQADREVVLAAVDQDNRGSSALEYASKELQADKEVVIAAVEQDGSALKYASEELRADKEVVLEAVKNSGIWESALKYASDELKGDPDFILAAVQKNGRALKQASEEFKGNKDIVLAAVNNDSRALDYASEELQADREVVLVAVKQDKYVLGYGLQNADESLKNDPEFMKEVEQYLTD